MAERDRYARAFAAFEACRAVTGDERERRLAEACGTDDALRREVLELLEHSDGTDPLTESRIAGRAIPVPAGAAEIPAEIGPYRVLGLLGEGSMGVVYEAEASFARRRVAVKLRKES